MIGVISTLMLCILLPVTASSYDTDASNHWLQISESLYDNGSYELALLAAERSLQFNDSSPMAWHQKGIILSKMERYERAIECNDKAIEIDPTYSSAWYEKGMVLDKLERYKDALYCYDMTVDCYENDLVKNKIFINMLGDTFERSTRYIESNALNSKGINLRRLGDYDGAIECYDQSIRVTERFVEEESRSKLLASSWNNKGHALLYVDRGDSSNYLEAIECFDNALRQEPANELLCSEALYNKGVAWLFIGNHSNAINCFDDAIESNGPNLWAAWFSKGIAFENLGDHESADFAFRKATEISGGKSLISILRIKSKVEEFKIYLRSSLGDMYAGIF